MPKLAVLTKTEDTKTAYKIKAISLAKKARKELEIPTYENLSLKQFVGWLCAYKNILSYASWKLYKASVVYFIEENYPDELEILEKLKEVTPDNKVKKTLQSSNKKMKKFPVNDFIAIVSFLEKSNYKNNIELKNWLYAGVLTGLRPVEWGEAKLSEDFSKLIVKNAKNTNGRSHGDFRTIHLEYLSDIEKKYIQEQVKNANYYKELGQYDKFQKSCGDLLRTVSKKLYPKRKQHPCLYSLRHQFAADAKASGLSREEIAALMGHAVDDTATNHYAKKQMGKSFTRVKADPEEVLRIKKVYTGELFLENVYKNKKKKG